MSDLSDFLTTHFDGALLVMGESCTVGGTSCNGVFSQFDTDSELTETAYQPSAQASVSVSKTDFPSSPAARATVVRANTNYTIISIEENDSGWVLGLTKEV